MLFRLLFGLDRVQSYTVHEGPHAPAERAARAEALVFVKDGFTVPAFAGAPVWLASHRMWWPLAGYVGLLALVGGLVYAFDLSEIYLLLALLGLHLLIGFEADALKRQALDADGYATLGAVTGKGALECERRFFDIWLPGVGHAAPTSTGAPARATAPIAAAQRHRIIGDLMGLGRGLNRR